MNAFQEDVEKINLPLGVKHYRKPDCDIVTWANKDLPKDIISIVVFLLVVFTVPIILTGLFRGFLFEAFALGILKLIREFLLQALVVIVLMSIWLGAIFLALVIFRSLFWTEAVVISDIYIMLSRKGFWAPKEMRFRREDFINIFYGRYDPWNEGELRNTLNIIYRHKLLGKLPGIQQEELASFSRKKEKYLLFLYLQTVLQKRDWPTLDDTRS